MNLSSDLVIIKRVPANSSFRLAIIVLHSKVERWRWWCNLPQWATIIVSALMLFGNFRSAFVYGLWQEQISGKNVLHGKSLSVLLVVIFVCIWANSLDVTVSDQWFGKIILQRSKHSGSERLPVNAPHWSCSSKSKWKLVILLCIMSRSLQRQLYKSALFMHSYWKVEKHKMCYKD